ncbi:hypothetical protein KEJ49_04595 [Candidatus Bathyarchaeota archaeon]|nr:hypothetical protein [Candidatus Bathyarchaeota archaeon]
MSSVKYRWVPLESRFPNIIGLLRRLADEKMYGILDRMVGALSPAAVELALYDAVRVARAWPVDKPPIPVPSSSEVERFLGEVGGGGIEGLRLARQVALKALTREAG